LYVVEGWKGVGKEGMKAIGCVGVLKRVSYGWSMLVGIKNFICDVSFCCACIALKWPHDAGEEVWCTINEVCDGLSSGPGWLVGKQKCTWLSCGKDAGGLRDHLGKIMSGEVIAVLMLSWISMYSRELLLCQGQFCR
jgi:hypothetical protein